MRVLLLGDHERENAKFEAYAAQQDDVELAAAGTELVRALEMAHSHAPDAVVLDLEPDGDRGLSLLRALKETGPERAPYVLVTASTLPGAVLSAVRELGADYIQSKRLTDYGPQMIIGFLRLLRPFFHSTTPAGAGAGGVRLDEAEREKLLRRRIGMAFDEIGLKSSHGRRYLIDAVLIQIRTGSDEAEMEKNIYPALEALYPGEKRGNMEKDMRYRIERTWCTTDRETLTRSYTKYISARKGKPELAEFISYYANKFKD